MAFGGPLLLDAATLHIDGKERICLVGRNGEGKSTLLRILEGKLLPDSGTVISSQEVRITSLAQHVPQTLSGTVFDIVLAGLGNIADLLSHYHAVSHRLAKNPNEALLTELEDIQHRIEAAGGWQVHRRIELVLSHLGLDADSSAADLSGGYKRRLLLAQALVSEPDLLLLDEPTNHLDIDSIQWLEEFLRDFRGAIVFITHDRQFLRTLATRIVELDRGNLTDWPGDYATYLKRRQAELDAEATQNALFDKKLAQEEAWIRQGIKARRTRTEGRVTALKEMRRERRERRQQSGSVVMRMNEAERSGMLVLEADSIRHSYDGRPIINDFSMVIQRGDKIGIIGPNGAGKTTLLRILLGELQPEHGSVRRGTRLEVAYFDQLRIVLDNDKSVVENVAEGTGHVTVNGSTRHVIGYLGDFLFPPERARLPVKVLSGGERNRALLAKLFTQPANVLVLDEPTNDLDSDTLELLEELLMQFEGTVLLVSHDREFLNNVVTSTIAFEGNGRLTEYVGGYDDWLRQRRTIATVESKKEPSPANARQQRARQRALTFNEKKELESLPPRIEALEGERDTLCTDMAHPDFYLKDAEKLPEIKARLEAVEQEISDAYERWEVLDAIPKGRE
ncbi:MAG TPA: ATP-binding cassette domain-containing protein [Dissulfurispiraceae bacterium]|nr:ATP-binding cassette domain-containing protein [Dissulfurispiraceae bacterium]